MFGLVESLIKSGTPVKQTETCAPEKFSSNLNDHH